MIVPGKGSQSNKTHIIQSIQREMGDIKDVCAFMPLQAAIPCPQYTEKGKRLHL